MKAIKYILPVFLLVSELCACTIGVVHGSISSAGRPLLWKNRDVSPIVQEVIFFDEQPYGFLTLVSQGERNRAWAGINEVGFAIVNSNSYNLPDSTDEGIDDGILMWLALKNCRTVDDFQTLLSSVNLANSYNFGVIDAYGNCAMFEVSPRGFCRIEVDSVNRFVVRANFSITGDNTRRVGLFRYLRARELIERRITHEKLDYAYIIDTVASDLCSEEIDPYPLPYEGFYRDFPQGNIPIYEAINRYFTRATVVIEGMSDPFDSLGGVMFTVMGQPSVSVPVPVWVRTKNVPSVLYGWNSPVCLAADSLRRFVEHFQYAPWIFDTYRFMLIANQIETIRQFVYEFVPLLANLDTENLRREQEYLGQEIYSRYRFIMPLLLETPSENEPEIFLNCYPNPFSSYINIDAGKLNGGEFEVEIYNINGQVVRRFGGRGFLKLVWDGRDDSGRVVAGGVYFAVMRGQERVIKKELIFIR